MPSFPVPDPGIPDHASPARYLRWLARTQVRTIAWGTPVSVVWIAGPAVMPAIVGRAIDAGVAARDVPALVTWTAVLLALGGLQAAAGVPLHRAEVRNWLSAAYHTIQVVTRQATRLGAALPRRITAGEIVSVGTSDIGHIGEALSMIFRTVAAVAGIGMAAALAIAAAPSLGLVVVVGVPVILALAAPLLRPMNRRGERRRELVGELTTRATDIVAGLRVLRGVGGEPDFAARYRAESQRVRRAGVAVARADSVLWGAEILLPGLLIVLVTWVGARMAVAGRLTVGELVSFYGFAVFLIHPMSTIGEAAGKLTRAMVAARRVVGILALEPDLPAAGTARPGPGRELADAASGLAITPGRLTAVAAADPADARALADRLGRFAEEPGADVTYGGLPLRDIADVRALILVAVNEDVLFTGTLRAALGGGDPGPAPGRVSKSPYAAQRDGGTLRHALAAACAGEVAAAAGLDVPIAEGGREFSGGQRQRLRLARALAADPEVLVLVDPTSAVDAHTEARIADRLRPARAGRTTVVCTTSPLVLDRADHVAFLEGGAVVAEGTHRALLAAEPRYAAAVTRGELGRV